MILLGARLALMALSTPPALPPPDTKVYYYFLFAITSVPIDAKLIRTSGFDLTSVVRGKAPSIVKALSQDSPGPKEPTWMSFNEKAIRLLLVTPKGKPIMLDLFGNVSGLDRPHWLNEEDRRSLRKLIFSAFPDG